MRFLHRLDDTTELVMLDSHSADEFYALVDVNRDYLRPSMPWVDGCTPDTMKAAMKLDLQKYANGTDLVLEIRYKGRLAGVIGLYEIDSHVGSADIGYWLGEEFEGKGLVTRACIAMLNHAFDYLGLNRVQIQTEPENRRSRAIPRRLGFHYEGTLRQMRRIGDARFDIEIYSMLKSEWETRRPG